LPIFLNPVRPIASVRRLHRNHYGDPQNSSSNSVHLWPGIFVGASYFLSPVFGFYAEAGADITNLPIGIIVKVR
jgi:hypothetical protein